MSKSKTRGWTNPLFTFKEDAFDRKTGQRSPLSLLSSMFWWSNIPSNFTNSKGISKQDLVKELFENKSPDQLKSTPIPAKLIDLLDEYRAQYPATWDPKHPDYFPAEQVFKIEQAAKRKQEESKPNILNKATKYEIDLTEEKEDNPPSPREDELYTKKYVEFTPEEEKDYVNTEFTFPLATSSSKKAETSDAQCKTFMIEWTRNSCWLDSVLLLYCTVGERFFIKNFLVKKLQKVEGKEARSAAMCDASPEKDLKLRQGLKESLESFFKELKSTRKRTKCVGFRGLFKGCSSLSGLESSNGVGDPLEFNELLLGLFGVNLNILQQNLSKNPKDPVIVESRDVPIIRLPLLPNLESQSKVKSLAELIKSQWHIPSDQKYPLSEFSSKILLQSIKSSLMFMHYTSPVYPGLVSRFVPRSIDWKIIYKEFNPDLVVDVSGNINSKYRLEAMVIGNLSQDQDITRHFTLMLRCKNTWFLFDDISHVIDKVGSYDDAIKRLEKNEQGVFIAAYNQQ
jgi:hypothetical protein